MRNIRIAECILELFTDRANAAATVGDLMELTAGQGSARFWGQIAQTALSHLWRDLSAEPLFLAGLAFRGVLFQLALATAFSAALVVLIPLIFLALPTARVSQVAPMTERIVLPSSSVPSLLTAGMPSLVFAGFLWVFYLTGGWIARRSRGRAVAVCVGLVVLLEVGFPLLGWVLMSVTGLGSLLAAWTNAHASTAPDTPDVSLSFYWFVPLAYALMLIAAVRVRRKSLSVGA